MRAGARAVAPLLVCLGVACGWTLALGASEALAHGETSQDINTVITRVDPRLPGVSIRTVTSTATALELVNRTPRVVEVLTDRGRPFLRIGPRGVEADMNSAAFYASGNPDGFATPPPEARLGAPASWKRVSDTPGWTWFEHRLHPTKIQIPARLRQEQKRRRLADWTVPLRYGGRPARIDGYLEYRPVVGSIVPVLGSSPRPAPGVAATMLPGPVPAIFLDSSSSRREVTVLGAAGEPFLRFDRSGVEANLRSPSHQADRRVAGQSVGVRADPRARPLWRRVSDGPRYTWFETRARYPREQPPYEVTDARKRKTLLAWAIPLEVGERRSELRGTTVWVPNVPLPRQTSPRTFASKAPGGLVAALAALTVIAIAGAALVARRSARRSKSSAKAA